MICLPNSIYYVKRVPEFYFGFMSLHRTCSLSTTSDTIHCYKVKTRYFIRQAIWFGIVSFFLLQPSRVHMGNKCAVRTAQPSHFCEKKFFSVFWEYTILPPSSFGFSFLFFRFDSLLSIYFIQDRFNGVRLSVTCTSSRKKYISRIKSYDLAFAFTDFIFDTEK